MNAGKKKGPNGCHRRGPGLIMEPGMFAAIGCSLSHRAQSAMADVEAGIAAMAAAAAAHEARIVDIMGRARGADPQLAQRRAGARQFADRAIRYARRRVDEIVSSVHGEERMIADLRALCVLARDVAEVL